MSSGEDEMDVASSAGSSSIIIRTGSAGGGGPGSASSAAAAAAASQADSGPNGPKSELTYYGHSPGALAGAASWHSDMDHGELQHDQHHYCIDAFEQPSEQRQQQQQQQSHQQHQHLHAFL